MADLTIEPPSTRCPYPTQPEAKNIKGVCVCGGVTSRGADQRVVQLFT